MEKITVAQLLEEHGLTWYGLFKRGAGSKSMCRDWTTGKHRPSTRSAARIARAIGLPTAYVLDLLRTRNQWENSPRVHWGTHIKKAIEAKIEAELMDRIESDGPCCPSCHQKLPTAA